MQTWSQFPRPRPTLLPEEQIDSLKQSNETRRRVVRHLTRVHACPVRNCCHLPSLCPGVKSPSCEGLLNSTRTLKHVCMSNCKRLWLTPSVLVPGEKEQFLQANNDLFCQLQGSFMPLEGVAPQVFEAIYQRQQGEILWLTVLWMIARINECWIGSDIPPHPQYFRSVVGAEPLKGMSPPHFHCMCPPVGESQVYGPSLSPADVTKEQEFGVVCGCSTAVTKSPLFSCSRRTLARNGKTSGMAKQPSCTNAHNMCCKQPAAPSSPTAATPGLSQWSLMETTFAAAASTYCLLAST